VLLARWVCLFALLPACLHAAGPRKIRDDKGYWGAVESYISERSEARFSHSMCPDCVKVYFPEMAEARDEMKRQNRS